MTDQSIEPRQGMEPEAKNTTRLSENLEMLVNDATHSQDSAKREAIAKGRADAYQTLNRGKSLKDELAQSTELEKVWEAVEKSQQEYRHAQELSKPTYLESSYGMPKEKEFGNSDDPALEALL